MIRLAHQWFWLLATREESHRVWGRFDHQRPGIDTNQMLAIATIVVLLAAVALIWQRAAKREKQEFASNSPRRLFRELCKAHNLGHAGRRLLWKLAAANGLENPAALFVEPRHFEAANVPAALKGSADELRALKSRLFG